MKVRKILRCCYWSPVIHQSIHNKNEIWRTINIRSTGDGGNIKKNFYFFKISKKEPKKQCHLVFVASLCSKILPSRLQGSITSCWLLNKLAFTKIFKKNICAYQNWQSKKCSNRSELKCLSLLRLICLYYLFCMSKYFFK